MTTPDNPDTPTQPVPAPAPAPRSASNTLLVKIAAVVGIIAGAFVILGVTFGLGVLAGSQCGHHGHHGGPGGPGERGGHHMTFDRDGQPPMFPPGGPVIIERGPAFGPPPSEAPARPDRPGQPQPPAPSTTMLPRP
ncbi:MAG: hypothetical protein ACRDUS_09770 [Mycobacterium sp.]